MSHSFVTPRTVGHQTSLSMGFPRQEYWTEWPFPSPGDLPNPGIKPASSVLVGVFFTTEPPGKPEIVSRGFLGGVGSVFSLKIMKWKPKEMVICLKHSILPPKFFAINTEHVVLSLSALLLMEVSYSP